MIEEGRSIHEDDICSICLMMLYKPLQLKTCKHVFCQACINEATDMYEHKMCPLCRKKFQNIDKVEMGNRQKELELRYPQAMKSRIQHLKQYKHYKLQVGNKTEFLNTQEDNKYKWTLFVRPAAGEPDLFTYVEKVQVKLHPTFNPSKVIFTKGQKIELTRIGWGTFRIQVKIQWQKKYGGGFTQVTHDLKFLPLATKLVVCKLRLIDY